MQQILPQIAREQQAGRDCVLVTLISSNGSAPRKAGSQMLAGGAGLLAGTIGGGAVEGHSLELAARLRVERRSDVRRFPLHPGERGDIGMICGGDVTAHFQFIPADDPVWQDVVRLANDRVAAHEPGRLLLREDGGTPTLLSPLGEVLCGTLPPQADVEMLLTGLCAQRGGCISLPLPVGQRALIFGGGHVSQALCPLLRSVDFRPWIFDCRPAFADRALFPDAEEVLCGDFTRIADYVTVTPEDYVVVMTSGHGFDFTVQEQVLRGETAYIGVIGSRRKTAAVNERLRAAGIPESAIARVHAPIGTAIRAVTPAEIAVSVAGEMICVRAERRGGEGHGCPMH